MPRPAPRPPAGSRACLSAASSHNHAWRKTGSGLASCPEHGGHSPESSWSLRVLMSSSKKLSIRHTSPKYID